MLLTVFCADISYTVSFIDEPEMSHVLFNLY